ncbi:MAG: hypothetical protein A3G93_07865 [Nitrospinae bacterium RIFCSPLOWO2_12_FULL_45_22]|nr:MAG: hypothetical protein A3G93_07865 [Nitrospinae bacterium RIFCSPLOWO2_12_FULL_45_22]
MRQSFIEDSSIPKDLAEDITKVAREAGTTLIGSVIGRGLFFITQVIIARFLGAEVFGLYILGLTILKITELISRFGLHTGAMRFVSIYRKESPSRVKGTLTSTLSISFINGIVLGVILFLLADLISRIIFHKSELKNIIQTFAFCVPFMASMTVVATASQGFHTAKYAVYIKNFIQPSANFALIFLFTLLGLGLSGIIYSFVISHIIALMVGLHLIKKLFPGLRDRTLRPDYEIKNLLIYSTPLVFTDFLHFLLSWTDIMMLGMMRASFDVGIYRAASQVPHFLTLILNASNSIYAPVIADLFYQGEKERLGKIFKTTTRWVFYITLPASLIFIFSAKEIMSIFGTTFVSQGAIVLIILTIAQLINCTTGGVGVTLTMTGKQNMEFGNSATLALLNIFLNTLLIPKYGVIGAAIATTIAISTINIVRLIEVFLLYRIHPYDLEYLKGCLAFIFLILVLFILTYMDLPNFISLLTNTVAVLGIFILILMRLGFNGEDRFIIEKVRSKLVFKHGLEGAGQ